jgi:hypothetical protein
MSTICLVCIVNDTCDMMCEEPAADIIHTADTVQKPARFIYICFYLYLCSHIGVVMGNALSGLGPSLFEIIDWYGPCRVVL